MADSRPEHWRLFDEFLTNLLGGLKIKRLGFWLAGSPKEEDPEFCIEFEDGTFLWTEEYYDEHWIEVQRPNGTIFVCKPSTLFGQATKGITLFLDRYESLMPPDEDED